MAKGKKKMNLILKTMITLAALGVITFVLLLGYVWIRESQVPGDVSQIPDDYDAVVVLGAQVHPDGVPSVQLAWRLDMAVKVWEKKHVPVIVCGAKGKDEPEPEAYVMKRYMEERGVAPEMILTDPDSRNTQQNLANARNLMEEYPEEIRKIVIVTSDYHVPRSMALAGDLGLEAVGIGSPCQPIYWLKNNGREALAWCKYWLNKYLHLDL